MSSVRVGLRIRPLLGKEKSQPLSIQEFDAHSLVMKSQQTFTYDHVFGPDMSQEQLYYQTAAPMMKNILEGYNVTIMAYGQTGSGKTFTMGTADTHDGESHDNHGLVPRFIADLFENIRSSSADDSSSTEKRESIVKVSFLEIYGEDVYDLIGPTANGNVGHQRPSLLVREDEGGHVFVQGLHEVQVTSAHAALEQLQMGSRNRITGSTQMNAGSSRSHAVYTVSIQQTIQSSSNDEDVHNISSTLTFVDLAGSERIKRTGAEGQRMKEGIQINSGLFNLGQVINCLADEQRIKQGVKIGHVPYRNSKLTHLLKDALGGNSQTLFLACVSPAESNESETASTLNYAKQARNIQNKPVQNVDKTQLEIRRLKYALKSWMLQAVSLKFGMDSSSLPAPPLGSWSPVKPRNNGTVKGGDDLWVRPDIQEFVSQVNLSIDSQLQQGSQPSPRKVRLSVLTSASLSDHNSIPVSSTSSMSSNRTSGRSSILSGRVPFQQQLRGEHLQPVKRTAEDGADEGLDGEEDEDGTLLNITAMSQQLKDSLLDCKDPEETAKLISRMMEMVTKEKELYLDDNLEEGELKEVELNEVEKAIEEKEDILRKLMDSVKSYSTMKVEFERLVDTIGDLETERNELEVQLERAKSQPALHIANNMGSTSSLAVEKLKERYSKVKEELSRMKNEKTNKENAYKLMQKESSRLDTMQKELQKLKESKVQLVRQQKLSTTQFQKLKKEQASKVMSLKRIDVKKQRQMNTLKSDVVKKERIIGNKDKEIARITSKLKACEEHITQLLKIQNRNRTKMLSSTTASSGAAAALTGGGVGGTGSKIQPPGNNRRMSTMASIQPPTSIEQVKAAGLLSIHDMEHLTTSKSILDNLVTERVEKFKNRCLLERTSAALRDFQSELSVESSRLTQMNVTRAVILSQLSTLLTLEIEELDMFISDGFLMDPSDPMGDQLRPEVREKRDALMELDDEISEAEGRIDSLSRDIDVTSADLEDLSARVGVLGDFSNSLDLWEDMGKEIVTGLSANQLQPLVWDILTEKCEAQELLQQQQADGKQLIEQFESSSEKIRDLQAQLQKVRSEMNDKLLRAEKQRVQDMWDLLKSQTGPNVAQQEVAMDPNGQMSSSSSLQIAILRANDLEAQLSNERSQSSEQAEAMVQLRRSLLEQQSLIQTLHLREGMGHEEDNQFSVMLVEIWNKLGLSQPQRDQLTKRIKSDVLGVRDAALSECRNDLHTAEEAVRTLTEEYHLMVHVIGAVSEHEALLSGINTRPLLQQLDQLTAATDGMTALLSERRYKFQLLSDKYKHLLVEMRITDPIRELPLLVSSSSSASSLIQLYEMLSKESAQPGVFMSPLTFASLLSSFPRGSLSDTFLSRWETELKHLNVSRVQVAETLSALLEKTRRLARDELGISLARTGNGSEEEMRLIGSIALLGSGQFEADNQQQQQQQSSFLISTEIMQETIDLLLDRNESTIGVTQVTVPGSPKILAAMERMLMMMESMKVNRQTVVSHICSFNSLLQIHLNSSSISDGSTLSAPSQSLYSSGCCRSRIEELFAEAMEVICPQPEQSQSSIFNVRRKGLVDALELFLKLSQKAGGGLEKTAAKMTQEFIDQSVPHLRPSLPSLFNDLDAIVEELSGLSVFVEEPFLQNIIGQLVSSWEAPSGKTFLQQTIMLHAEAKRVSGIFESLEEVVKLDQQLAKQVSDMEEFELHSKQERSKLLSGSSKGLIEEEKFRKQSKRKFENISEKIVLCYAQLQHLLVASQPSATSSSSRGQGVAKLTVDISLDSQSFLSSQAQSLVRGKRMEKIELMHLHTTTHGTRRWSDENSSENQNPGASTHNTNLTVKSSSASGGNNSEKRSLSPTPTSSAHLVKKRSLSPLGRSHNR